MTCAVLDQEDAACGMRPTDQAATCAVNTAAMGNGAFTASCILNSSELPYQLPQRGKWSNKH